MPRSSLRLSFLFKRIVITLFALSLSCPCFGQTEVDRCEALIPATLKEAVNKQYPDYRLAHVADYPPKIIEDQAGFFPNHPCLAVASVDVDGDGRRDYALFVVDSSGRALLIGSRDIGGGTWHVSTLYDFHRSHLGTSYVDVIKPGTYQDLFADTQEYKAEPGRVKKLTSRKPGFTAGTIESSAAAFFFTGKRWVHLWLTD